MTNLRSRTATCSTEFGVVGVGGDDGSLSRGHSPLEGAAPRTGGTRGIGAGEVTKENTEGGGEGGRTEGVAGKLGQG